MLEQKQTKGSKHNNILIIFFFERIRRGALETLVFLHE
jgi:hypothetical protein